MGTCTTVAAYFFGIGQVRLGVALLHLLGQLSCDPIFRILSPIKKLLWKQLSNCCGIVLQSLLF